MHMGSGNHTQVLRKSSKCSQSLSCPSSPCLSVQSDCTSLPYSFVWTSLTESLFRNWDQVLGLGLAGSLLLPLVICILSPHAPLLLRHSLTERRPLPLPFLFQRFPGLLLVQCTIWAFQSAKRLLLGLPSLRNFVGHFNSWLFCRVECLSWCWNFSASEVCLMFCLQFTGLSLSTWHYSQRCLLTDEEVGGYSLITR